MSEGTKISGEEDQFNEIIETLPREQWIDKLYLFQYQGFWYPLKFLKGLISLQHNNFKPHSTYITALCGSPKTGTTWLKSLSFAIVTRNRGFSRRHNDDDQHSTTLLTRTPRECVPFLEVDLVIDHHRDQHGGGRGSRWYKGDTKLPLFSTHVPYTSLPKSIVESSPDECKIVYIWRDPKDTFISLWYFQTKYLESKESKLEFCFDVEFDRFCNGKSHYGPFWEHVLGFWKASLECSDKVLFLKYEDMKRDTLLYIRKLAEFMNQPFSEEEENEGVPRKIMEFCDFKNLSNLEVNKTGTYMAHGEFGINNNLYFRRGEVGDWKTHFTAEMVDRIDAITKEKFCDSGLIII